MREKIRWGIMGVANIAVKKVIPAMQHGKWSEVAAIASRDLKKAQDAASRLGIEKAYGSYDELLSDSQIEAIYIPLPNHMHVVWTTRAAEAGKHVLCEKPIGLTAAEASSLIQVRDRTGVKIEEAFMVRTHPQWILALNLIAEGRIGKVQTVTGYFSYFNNDPANIRNIAEYGGGGLMDIGCYLILASRLVFNEEPLRVLGLMNKDVEMKTDTLTSAILEFPSGHSVFGCSTQTVPYQRVHILGTQGRIEIEIPFNAPPDRACRVFLDDGSDLLGEGTQIHEVDVCDQYTLQGDLFSEAVRNGSAQALSLEDSIINMSVIDALTLSAASGKWEKPVGY
jgi:predicted dehydrogenase